MGSAMPFNEQKKKPQLVRTGAVIIGRNEGERLEQCLISLPSKLSRVVYVDSDSSDDSVAFAKRWGAEVEALDMSIPFSAARARNQGFSRLMTVAPQTEYVLFLDGDCEVVQGWCQTALALLLEEPDVLAVCGRRRERYPQRTLYNCICDIEWRISPSGYVKNFGGDVMLKVAPIQAVRGYNPHIIAAEDDEFSIRLRATGGKILRVEEPATIHDANITRFSQWWRRAKRCGHGYANLFDLHGKPPETYFRRELCACMFWGIVYPLSILLLTLLVDPCALLLLSVYGLQAIRNYHNLSKLGYTHRESLIWSLACVAAKFPEAIGIATYFKRRLLKREFTLIEYK